MKLLIIGASGFIGRNIVKLASRGPWDVSGVYWKSRNFPDFAKRHDCVPIRCNLLGETQRWDADACIYVAGNADHLASLKSPLSDYRQNVEALHRFIAGFRGGLVFVSSAAVYDGRVGRVSPRTPLKPRFPYAISKLACERYVDYFVSRGDLERGTVLRLYYAYGPYDRRTRLVPRLISAMETGAREFVITAPRNTLVDPMYVEDVARAALSAAKGAGANETLDLCGGHPQQVVHLAKEAIQFQGGSLRLVHRPRKGEVPLRFHSDVRPAVRRLGLPMPLTFVEGLRRLLSWRAVQGE